MGKLAGYREIVRRLKEPVLELCRQATGSLEIWVNPAVNRYATIPIHPRRRA